MVSVLGTGSVPAPVPVPHLTTPHTTPLFMHLQNQPSYRIRSAGQVGRVRWQLVRGRVRWKGRMFRFYTSL